MNNGQPARLRDELGLRLDTRLYAKSSCKDCHGRGTLTLVTHVPMTKALALVKENPANEALLFQNRKGGYEAKDSTMCGCAKRRYQRVYGEFGDALVKANLATIERDDKGTITYKLS
jgi:hypothetical protein